VLIDVLPIRDYFGFRGEAGGGGGGGKKIVVSSRSTSLSGAKASIAGPHPVAQPADAEELVRRMQPLHARCWLSARERSR